MAGPTCLDLSFDQDHAAKWGMQLADAGADRGLQATY